MDWPAPVYFPIFLASNLTIPITPMFVAVTRITIRPSKKKSHGWRGWEQCVLSACCCISSSVIWPASTAKKRSSLACGNHYQHSCNSQSSESARTNNPKRTLYNAFYITVPEGPTPPVPNPANVHPKPALSILVKKMKINFVLEQAMEAQRGSRGIALLFL